MSLSQPHPWLPKTLAWFDKHPEREFHLTRIPLDALEAVGRAGWIVGVASQPIQPNGIVGADVAVGATSISCVVRRPDAASGRPFPGVLLMDGVGAMPPLPKSKHFPSAQQARKEEKLAEGIWALAQAAAAEGLSLIAAMRFARSAQATPRSR